MSKKVETDTVKETQFNCACHSRDHTIRAQHDYWEHDGIHELSLEFKLRYGDWNALYGIEYDDNWFKEKYIEFRNFLRRMRWRIKKASRLLFFGYLEMEDCWTPAYTDKDYYTGTDETRRLAKWLNDVCDTIEEDCKNENRPG